MVSDTDSIPGDETPPIANPLSAAPGTQPGALTFLARLTFQPQESRNNNFAFGVSKVAQAFLPAGSAFVPTFWRAGSNPTKRRHECRDCNLRIFAARDDFSCGFPLQFVDLLQSRSG